jgi:hypothetical protein
MRQLIDDGIDPLGLHLVVLVLKRVHFAANQLNLLDVTGDCRGSACNPAHVDGCLARSRGHFKLHHSQIVVDGHCLRLRRVRPFPAASIVRIKIMLV